MYITMYADDITYETTTEQRDMNLPGEEDQLKQ